MKKHALILGTLTGQAEAMEWLKANGWSVSACGHVKAGPGVDVADQFYLVDILDVDKVTELASTIKADVVYSVGSDIAMPTVASVSERLGLPHFYNVETTNILHRKVLTRQFLNDHNISPTRFQRIQTEVDLNNFTAYPAILKPTDSQGQRGISIVNSHAEAVRNLPESIAASRSGNAIIEELIDGPEVSVHAFIVDSEVKFLLPSDRHLWQGSGVGIPAGHVVPAKFIPVETLPAISKLVESCVKALQVKNGPLYFQMKLSKDKGPRIIEIAPRLDGCHMWRLIEYYCGFNLIAACFDRLMGLPWQPHAPFDPARSCSLWFHMQKTGDKFRQELHKLPDHAECLYQHFLYAEGDTVRVTNGATEKVGYYILRDR